MTVPSSHQGPAACGDRGGWRLPPPQDPAAAPAAVAAAAAAAVLLTYLVLANKPQVKNTFKKMASIVPEGGAPENVLEQSRVFDGEHEHFHPIQQERSLSSKYNNVNGKLLLAMERLPSTLHYLATFECEDNFREFQYGIPHILLCLPSPH